MIVVGIDGGGTKTHALAVDERGNILGSATGGPSNYHSLGLPNALDVLADATRQALSGQRADIAVYCLGACDSDVDEQRLTEGLCARNLAARVICYNDSFAPLRAGSSRPYGVAVICGTGFNACGIAPDGRQARLYSLGPLTGDWGGGTSIGEAMFGAAYRAEDGRGQPTMLTEMLLKAFDVPDLKTLAYRIADRKIHHRDVARLAPLVFEAAEAGDAVARAIVLRQADEIAIAALAMLRRLDMTDLDVDVILSGGVINGRGPLLLEATTRQITAVCPKACVRRLHVPPVIGAVALGFDALGLPAPQIDGSQLSIAWE